MSPRFTWHLFSACPSSASCCHLPACLSVRLLFGARCVVCTRCALVGRGVSVCGLQLLPPSRAGGHTTEQSSRRQAGRSGAVASLRRRLRRVRLPLLSVHGARSPEHNTDTCVPRDERPPTCDVLPPTLSSGVWSEACAARGYTVCSLCGCAVCAGGALTSSCRAARSRAGGTLSTAAAW